MQCIQLKHTCTRQSCFISVDSTRLPCVSSHSNSFSFLHIIIICYNLLFITPPNALKVNHVFLTLSIKIPLIRQVFIRVTRVKSMAPTLLGDGWLTWLHEWVNDLHWERIYHGQDVVDSLLIRLYEILQVVSLEIEMLLLVPILQDQIHLRDWCLYLYTHECTKLNTIHSHIFLLIQQLESWNDIHWLLDQ